ncbi:hypothetical protein DPMN_045760 [Dreissena polymorpha]|uniref:Uncharacterized protein n=1 Tax=Dreissena polymorpha TaxID=45954 RepID=A0A9D4D8D5_DREPO|nr:hypothetical protein DPMN_045760 [Dreissena polymorpha]
MALPFLPAEHIPSMFDELDEHGDNDRLDAVMAYVFSIWINRSVFSMECWSIFMKGVRTKNECE